MPGSRPQGEHDGAARAQGSDRARMERAPAVGTKGSGLVGTALGPEGRRIQSEPSQRPDSKTSSRAAREVPQEKTPRLLRRSTTLLHARRLNRDIKLSA